MYVRVAIIWIWYALDNRKNQTRKVCRPQNKNTITNRHLSPMNCLEFKSFVALIKISTFANFHIIFAYFLISFLVDLTLCPSLTLSLFKF